MQLAVDGPAQFYTNVPSARENTYDLVCLTPTPGLRQRSWDTRMKGEDAQTHRKTSRDLARLRVRCKSVFRNFPQLAEYKYD